MLRHELEVRRIGLASFGLGNLAEGAPLSDLEARFLPLYLHHRYQLAAAAKTLGGVEYTNAVKGAKGPSPSTVAVVVPADRQREALKAILETLEPKELQVPGRILDLIPPTAFGHDGGTAELFTNRTGRTFDPIGCATIAADLAISALLQPQRAARLVEFHARNRANPGFDEVLKALQDRLWDDRPRDSRLAAIQDAVKHQYADRLMALGANEAASPQVRAIAGAGLYSIVATINAMGVTPGRPPNADDTAIRSQINRFFNRPDPTYRSTEPLPSPPGDPIGSGRAVSGDEKAAEAPKSLGFIGKGFQRRDPWRHGRCQSS